MHLARVIIVFWPLFTSWFFSSRQFNLLIPSQKSFLEMAALCHCQTFHAKGFTHQVTGLGFDL